MRRSQYDHDPPEVEWMTHEPVGAPRLQRASYFGTNTRELERIDGAGSADNEPEAGKLHGDRDRRRPAVNRVHIAADWHPERQGDNEQQARSPDVHRTKERLGDNT